jgi:ankyrin repeat protein
MTDIIDDILNNQGKKTLSILKCGYDVEAQDEGGKTALIWAVMLNDIELVELLLKFGANSNAVDRDGQTALMLSSSEGYADIVKKLLSAGSMINIQDNEGDSALMSAAKSGNTDIARILINSGAVVDLEDNCGRTSLTWAILRCDSPETVKELISAGANVNIKTRDGQSILEKAKALQKEAMIELLINAGAEE